MQLRNHAGPWLLVLALGLPGAAAAEPVTYAFRLVTQVIEEAQFAAPAGNGRVLRMNRSVGTAVFEDGRIAHKVFTGQSDGTAESGDFTGYSSYVFESGDRLDLTYAGGWSAEGAGGEYTVLSGTGAFAGATGSGRFEATGVPWDKATLWEGQLILDMPGS